MKKCLRVLIVIFCISATVVQAESRIHDTWKVEGSSIAVDAVVVDRPSSTGDTVEVGVMPISKSDLLNAVRTPYKDSNRAETSNLWSLSAAIYSVDSSVGSAAFSSVKGSHNNLDLRGWSATIRDLPGFAVTEAKTVAETALKDMGLPVSDPYFIEVFGMEKIEEQLKELESDRAVWSSIPELKTNHEGFKALHDERTGFYVLYYATQYQGVPLMPFGIHDAESYAMNGAYAAFVIAKNGIQHMHIHGCPDLKGTVIESHGTLDKEEAIQSYKRQKSELLGVGEQSTTLFRIAYEYVPKFKYADPTVATLLPVWSFYEEKVGPENDLYFKVVLINAYDGELISR